MTGPGIGVTPKVGGVGSVTPPPTSTPDAERTPPDPDSLPAVPDDMTRKAG